MSSETSIRSIWGIFVVGKADRFPNFYPIGLFDTREQAIEALESLPKDANFQLLKLPVGQLFPYYHKKSGKLIGMDGIYHEHFHFRDDMHM